MNKPERPEVLAVVPLPSATERRRREIMLARVLLVAMPSTSSLQVSRWGWRRPATWFVKFGNATLSYQHTGTRCEREMIACIGWSWMRCRHTHLCNETPENSTVRGHVWKG
jgi:hypothetical protein